MFARLKRQVRTILNDPDASFVLKIIALACVCIWLVYRLLWSASHAPVWIDAKEYGAVTSTMAPPPDGKLRYVFIHPVRYISGNVLYDYTCLVEGDARGAWPMPTIFIYNENNEDYIRRARHSNSEGGNAKMRRLRVDSLDPIEAEYKHNADYVHGLGVPVPVKEFSDGDEDRMKDFFSLLRLIIYENPWLHIVYCINPPSQESSAEKKEEKHPYREDFCTVAPKTMIYPANFPPIGVQNFPDSRINMKFPDMFSALMNGIPNAHFTIVHHDHGGDITQILRDDDPPRPLQFTLIRRVLWPKKPT
jgi:hypothetical protein